MKTVNYLTIAVSCLTFLSDYSIAKNIQEMSDVEVIGITPTHGIGLPETLIPFSIQSATSADIHQSQTLGLTDFMNSKLGGITINEAQNNPLQADIQYRGYTLSPLLGLPQGLAIYQNGVRINEPFGDTMNWDLVPQSSIAGINLMGGANPIFGLNTLGGALSITTKNGFTHPGHGIETHGGSFGRYVTTVESGGNNGSFGYYFTADYFDEDGWRDRSPSDALNLFGTLAYRSVNTTLDLDINHANTKLIGNGASPVELLASDREAIFTAPDITENKMVLVNLGATHWLSSGIQLSGNMFYRDNKTNSFNGDGTEYEDCGLNGGVAGELCEEGDDASIEDQNGGPIATTNLNDSERNAINNISERQQKSFGVNLQASFMHDLFDKQNQLVVGTGYLQGLIDFFSTVQIATLNCEYNGSDCTSIGADRSTTPSPFYVPEEGTNIRSHHRVWSLYATDTIFVTERLTLTASARYNNSHIVIGYRADNDLAQPEDPDELNGEHDFDRINPAFGFTYQIDDNNGFYGSYSESARAPTPVELLCAREYAPCNLPNAFLADPPLEQVVAKGFEGGFRGSLKHGINYNISAFHNISNDDIIFGSTGGTTSSQGFFRNVGDTRRLGAELALSGNFNAKINWYMSYNYVEATFEDTFIGISANHPNATDLNGDGDDDEIQVNVGDRIPGIPKHSLKIGGIYAVTSNLSVGASMIYNSNQILRGDESNQLSPVSGYTVVNINGSYQFSKHFTLFARINNLFDTDYETFGLLGEADEVFDGSGTTTAFDDPKFLSPAAPINGFIGLTVVF